MEVAGEARGFGVERGGHIVGGDDVSLMAWI